MAPHAVECYAKAVLANLVNGAKVEVKGMASPDGTMIVATSISFE